MFRQLMEGAVDDWSWHAHNLAISCLPALVIWVGLENVRREMVELDEIHAQKAKDEELVIAPETSQPALEVVAAQSASEQASTGTIRELTLRLDQMERQQLKLLQMVSDQPVASPADAANIGSATTASRRTTPTIAAASLAQQLQLPEVSSGATSLGRTAQNELLESPIEACSLLQEEPVAVGGESGDGRNDSAYIAKHVMLVPVAGYLGYFLLNWLGRK